MKTLAAAVLAVLVAGLPAAHAQQKPLENRPKIEMVFAIDTTSSMGGLIEAAKAKVWSIVNQIGTGKPAPEVRVGLVAFRDRGDEYVTQVTDLTPDLDAMYSKLMSFSAQGGGDGPESVNQALADAVHKISWGSGKNVLRLVFLVGDAPPHMDYPNDVKYAETAKAAVLKNITVHTIRCGSDPTTEKVWQEIARSAEGRYFSIDSSGGAVAISTPFDSEIARLDDEMRASTLAFGSRAEREGTKHKLGAVSKAMAAAPAEAKAERALYAARMSASAPSAVYGSDLVSAVESRSVELDKVAEEQLPDEMRKMSAAERKAYLEKKSAERKAMQAKLDKLSRERASFIAEQQKKAGGRDSFDAKVLDAVREKSGRIGVSY